MRMFQRYFAFIKVLFANCVLYGQSDTLILADGTVLVGSYKVAHNLAQVENLEDYKVFYLAKKVESLSTAKGFYHTVNINIKGEPFYFMAKRMVDSEVDLYGADFPSGYFDANSVAQSFYFFEKNGVFTYVNKSKLEAFYNNYFGNCYGWIPDKKLLYNKDNVTYMLNAYNRCLNPNAPQQFVEPTLSEFSLVAFGGIARLRHYPLNVAFNDGEFKDHTSQLGLGVSFVIKKKIAMGIEVYQSQHSITSPTFVSAYLQYYNPMMINYSFKTIGINLSGAYVYRFNKLSLQPGVSVGVGKIYDYHDAQVQPELYINYQPFFYSPYGRDIFTFEQLYYRFKGFVQINYGLTRQLSLMARGGFDLSFTKSLVGYESPTSIEKQGNYAIDGGLFELGLMYKLRK